jgi:hypothetical protein
MSQSNERFLPVQWAAYRFAGVGVFPAGGGDETVLQRKRNHF